MVWILAAAGIAAAMWFVPPVQFDQSIEGFFPDDDPGIQAYRRARVLFGNDDLVFVAFEEPNLWTAEGIDRLVQFAEELSTEIPGVLQVESLASMPVPWRVDSAVESMASGRLSLLRIAAARATVGDIVPLILDDPERLREFRNRICSHPLFRGVVVDETGRMAAIIVTMDDPRRVDHKAVLRGVRSHADEFAKKHGLGAVHVAGPPVLVSDGFDSLDRDNRTLGAIAMTLMALTMLIAVRNPGWALLPLVSGWATWQLVRTMLWYFDLRLTLSSGPIVAQTVVLCMPAASHLAMRFRENMQLGGPLPETSKSTLGNVAVPIAWCAATAAAGYLAAWTTTRVVPVAQFGVTMCLSNLAAGLFSFLLAAGAMAASGLFSRRRTGANLPGRVSRLTAWVINSPWLVVGGFVLPSVLMATGIHRLELESNYINIFRARSRVVTDYKAIERQLGGIGVLEVVLPAPDYVDVEWLDDLRTASAQIRAMGPEVISDVFSLADLLLPENQNSLSEELVQEIVERKASFLQLPKFAYLLDRLWNAPEGATRILIRIHDSAPADVKERFLERLSEWAAARSEQPVIVTGLSRLLMQITESVIRSSYGSATASALMIVTMLLLALRNIPLTILAMFPTALSVGLVLGMMGWLGLKVDLTTALVASVAIGLSVDDTFHCLLHWQQELRHGKPPREAILASYASSGPGVILSSSAVSLGFLASMTSEFVPTANFGWLVGIATLGGSAGNLVVLPALLSLSERFSRGRAVNPADGTR